MDVEKMVAQLDELIAQYQDVAGAKQGLTLIVNRLEAAIDRLAMPGSTYIRQLDAQRKWSTGTKAFEVWKIAEALREDLKSGWTDSVIELVHADTHSDYLEMAASLLESAHKDAAAVIAGTALEVHVRALCVKHGVDTELPTGAPKKASVMNSDLKKAGVYATLQEKQVTAWMDLRNQAAHGNYEKYDTSEVRALTSGVRDFMLKYPA
ncbi:hypothetical protein ACFY5F_48515 [Streptomyces sp. NPDC013161]|uniref:hypothetical protein n=1 Tax=Streptomyces sp. NPDC013161 TaxID=3364862 RepID=UPI0036BBBF41